MPAPLKKHVSAAWSAASWQRYLPPDFILAADDEQERIMAHLRDVWQAVQTYLPRRAVRRLLSGLAPGEMWGEMTEGTFLFADISGFTALAERLGALPDGTEKLTALINNYFTAMLQVAAQSCPEMIGDDQDRDPAFDLLKFGGDAMLLLFSGPHHARLAVQAAIHMQQNMPAIIRQAQALGAASLGMHIGINSGRFLDAHVGTPRVMRKVEVGRTLNLTALAEEVASSGQIAIGPDTYEAVSGWIETSPAAQGFYLVEYGDMESADAPPPPAPPAIDPPHTLDDLIAALDTMVPYLLPGLLEKIILAPREPVVWADLKPVTVLFANLLGLNEMVEALGEGVTAIMDRYLGAVSEIVSRYDGTFNKMDLAQEGDKLLILFGAPQAHEDDPQRAVRAALEMQEALRPFTKLSTLQGTFSLRQRMGIHSGTVFAGNVGSPARKEYTVMGDAVNLAARLMAAAGAGQIILSRETQRRLNKAFDCRPLSALRVKGKAEPVPVYQVAGLLQEGFITRRAARHGELIGRQREIEILKAAAGRALGGEGQVVSVIGSAGVGKSRLVDELAAHAESLGMGVLRGGCISYGGAMAYLPWIEILREFLGWNNEDRPAQRQEKLRAVLKTTDPALVDWAPIVAAVLGLALPETFLTRALNAKLRKERFFDIVSQLLETRAVESPLLLIFEDLHWADPISLELLDYVARNLGDSPLLLLGIRRPEGARPQWDDLAHHQVIHLDELSRKESLELAVSLLQGTSLPPDLEAIILERAQGNPFYVEEVTHVLLDQGHLARDNGQYRLVGDPSAIEIPDTINGVVMSRIDSLDEGSRTVLRVASVIGRQFLYGVLKTIYPQRITAAALRRRLDTLQRVDLTPLEDIEPDMRYIFKHILTQEVAYESLLHARRRDLHGQVGLHYEAAHQQELEEYYDLLAYHFGRSAYRDKALEYTIHAADRSKSAYANDAARTRLWADVQFNLAEVYIHVGRYEEAISGYQSAMEAAGQNWSAEQQSRTLRKIGWTFQLQGQYAQALDWLLKAKKVAESDPAAAESRQMSRILADTGAVYIRQADFEKAINLIEQSLELLSRLPQDAERLLDEGWAYTRLGVVHTQQGNLEQAKSYFEQSLKLRAQAGDLVGVATLHNNLGYIAHHLQGDLAAAIESYGRSLEVCRQIGYRYMMAMASNNLGMAYQVSGNHQQAIACYQQSLQIRQEMGDLYGIASTYDNVGLAYHQRGDYEKAMEYHHLSLAIKREQKDNFQIANSLINIAAVCCDQENYEEAVAFTEEASEIFQEIGGREYLAETYAVLASALLMTGERDLAHKYAALALETAEETGNPKERARAARVLGEVETLFDLDSAQDRLRRSVELLEKVGDRFELAKSLRSLARCLKLEGLETEGESCLTRAAQIFQDLDAQGELKKLVDSSY